MSSDDEDGLPETIDSEDARVVVGRRRAMVIDIRDEEEFAEERIFSAEQVAPDAVRERIDEVLADDEDERDAFLIICSDGSESADVAKSLRDEGYAASSLDGGFRAWTGDHLPTAPGRDEEYEGPKQTVPGAVASETQPDEDENGDEEGGGPGGSEDARAGGDDGDADDDAAAAEAGAEAGRAQSQPEEISDEEKAERAEDA